MQHTFFHHKILIIKEEGDTSQVNQSHDQSVAGNDKAGMRQLVDLVAPKLRAKMDQWCLIGLAINAQLKVEPKAWSDSFKKVNLHPQFRVPFDDWIKTLDKRGFLATGEKFFEKRDSLHDAMPACWKNMPVEHCHQVLSIVKDVCKSKPDGEPVWTKTNTLHLTSCMRASR